MDLDTAEIQITTTGADAAEQTLAALAAQAEQVNAGTGNAAAGTTPTPAAQQSISPGSSTCSNRYSQPSSAHLPDSPNPSTNMAISRKFQARATVTRAVHSQLVTGAAALRARRIELIANVANPDGTVTVTLAGRGLGPKATPAAPPVNISIEAGQIKVLPLE